MVTLLQFNEGLKQTRESLLGATGLDEVKTHKWPTHTTMAFFCPHLLNLNAFRFS